MRSIQLRCRKQTSSACKAKNLFLFLPSNSYFHLRLRLSAADLVPVPGTRSLPYDPTDPETNSEPCLRQVNPNPASMESHQRGAATPTVPYGHVLQVHPTSTEGRRYSRRGRAPPQAGRQLRCDPTGAARRVGNAIRLPWRVPPRYRSLHASCGARKRANCSHVRDTITTIGSEAYRHPRAWRRSLRSPGQRGR